MGSRWLSVVALLFACTGKTPATDASTDGAADAGNGGGDGGGGDDDYTSGSRLRAQLLVTPDGQREFRGFLDTQLGTTCWFATAGDGMERCLPSDTEYAGWYFLDGNCSRAQAVAADYTDCPAGPPAYLMWPDDSICPPVTRIHRTGSAVTPTMLWFLDSVDGSCRMTTPTAGTTYYKVGAEVPPTNFVAGVRRVDGSGRLQREGLDGEDGSRLATWRISDSDRAETCSFDVAADGEVRCLPTASVYDSGYFGDTACTSPVVTLLPGCTVPEYVDRTLRDSCPARTQVFERGAQVAGMAYFLSTATMPAMCLASGIGPPWQIYGFGAEVTPPSFERADLVLAGGSERVREEAYVTGDGLRVGAGWRDTQRDEACWFGRASDDTYRCMSIEAWLQTDLYTDMTCTTPWRAGGAYRGWCANPEAPKTLGEQLDRCPIAYRLYEAGPKVTPPPLFLKLSTGECLTYDPGVWDWYQLGAEIAPAQLVQATPVTE